MAARAAEAPRELSIITKATLKDMADDPRPRRRRRPRDRPAAVEHPPAVVRRAARRAAGPDLQVLEGLITDGRGALCCLDRYLEQYFPLDPLAATYDGEPGYETQLPDLSPEGSEAIADLARATLAELDRTPAEDDADTQCALLLRDRLGAAVEFHEAGEDLRPLFIFGPHLQLRAVFRRDAHRHGGGLGGHQQAHLQRARRVREPHRDPRAGPHDRCDGRPPAGAGVRRADGHVGGRGGRAAVVQRLLRPARPTRCSEAPLGASLEAGAGEAGTRCAS